MINSQERHFVHVLFGGDSYMLRMLEDRHVAYFNSHEGIKSSTRAVRMDLEEDEE